jgi:hypothetical protein
MTSIIVIIIISPVIYANHCPIHWYVILRRPHPLGAAGYLGRFVVFAGAGRYQARCVFEEDDRKQEYSLSTLEAYLGCPAFRFWRHEGA